MPKGNQVETSLEKAEKRIRELTEDKQNLQKSLDDANSALAEEFAKREKGRAVPMVNFDGSLLDRAKRALGKIDHLYAEDPENAKKYYQGVAKAIDRVMDNVADPEA